MKRYRFTCEDPYCMVERTEEADGEYVLASDVEAVYDAAMDLSDKLGDFWLGWFIAEDKLPEQYRPIVDAVDALVRECRRAKEGR